MKNLLRFFKPYRLMLVGILVLTYLQVMANLQLPDFMAHIVNDGVIKKDNSVVYNYGWLMLLVSFGGAIAAVMGGFFASKVATGFARDIRHAVFSRVESFSAAEFDTFSTASLITRSTNDIQQIQMVLILLLRMVLIAPFMAVGALQKALADAPSLSWIIALAVTVMTIVIVMMIIIVMPRFKRIQLLVDKLNLVTRENLTGLRVVRAFHKEATEEAKFERVNADLTGINLFVNRIMMLMQPLMTLVLNGAILCIVWYGAKLVDAGTINIGNMMAFMQYAMQVIMSFLMMSIIFIMVPRAAVSAKRVGEVLATELSVKDLKSSKVLPGELKGLVEFRDVTFKYTGAAEPILKKVSFSAEPGQTTAIIGGTGSGKSTLVGLIPRLYDVTGGSVLFDGVDIRELKQDNLRQYIGYVPQKATLFSGTVESNVRYGNRKASDKLVRKAIAVAQATEFVDDLPEKYAGVIAQGGANVSGGQKQRLAIARAIAVQPKVYVFDDSFSALDLKTDRALRAALKPLTQESTVIVVAQRISTIIDADKIVVLDEGKVVGIGTHDELMKQSKVYREIAYSQLSEEELTAIADLQKELARG